jgi:hypothetical protein
MKQTAVEYLVKELSEILGPLKTEAMQDLLLVDAINKAKEMEKQQQGYSEEEVWNICNELASYFIGGDTFDLKEWFEQFKKK